MYPILYLISASSQYGLFVIFNIEGSEFLRSQTVTVALFCSLPRIHSNGPEVIIFLYS